jgi:hypothetical protein
VGIVGGKYENPAFQNLKEEENIYAIMKGSRSNPFISIGAYGTTGSDIRGHFAGIIPGDYAGIGPEKAGSDHYGITLKRESIYLAIKNLRRHPFISIGACAGAGSDIRGHFSGCLLRHR